MKKERSVCIKIVEKKYDMRKVVVFIAMSLDGYVADVRGGISWLCGDGSDPENMGTYPKFIETVDTIIMGFSTYDQITSVLSPDQWPYKDQTTYVMTRREMSSRMGVVMVNGSLHGLISRLKTDLGKDIWICGGARIINQLVQLDLIDRYHISVIPIILGDGLPLFDKRENSLSLKLVSTAKYNGIVDLVYERE